MAMVMMSSERMSPSAPPSQVEAHTINGDFTESSVANSNNDLQVVQATSAWLDGQMPHIPEVEILRTVLLWMFYLCLSLLSFLRLYFVTFLITAQYKWRRHGFLPPPPIIPGEEEFPRTPDPLNSYHTVLISYETYGFVLLRKLKSCMIVSFPFLFYSCKGLSSPGGLHQKRGIMKQHGGTWRVKGPVTPTVYIVVSLLTLDP